MTLSTTLLFTSSMTSSVISPKIIYVIVPKEKKYIICEVRANNYDWLKNYLSFMSKGGTTCPKL